MPLFRSVASSNIRLTGEYFAYVDHGYIYDLTPNVIGYFAENGRDVYDLSGNYLGYFHP